MPATRVSTVAGATPVVSDKDDGAEASAAKVLAQRREQNRLAQKRFRDRAKEARQAKQAQEKQQQQPLQAVASRSTSSGSSPSGSAASSGSGSASNNLAAAAAAASSSTPIFNFEPAVASPTSYAQPSMRSSVPPVSAAPGSVETFAWLMNAMGPQTKSKEHVDPQTGLTAFQASLCAAYCPDGVEKAMAQLEPNGPVHSPSSAAAARAQQGMPQQTVATSAPAYASPPGALPMDWFSPTAMQDFTYDAGAPPASAPSPPKSPASLSTHDWQALFDHSMLAGATDADAAAAQVLSFGTHHPQGSMMTLDSLASSSLGIGDSGAASSASFVSSGSSNVEDTGIEVIGSQQPSDASARATTFEEISTHAREALKKYKRLTQGLPLAAKIEGLQGSQLPLRSNTTRAKPVYIMPPTSVLARSTSDGGRISGTMDKDWISTSPIVSLLNWSLYLRSLPPAQFQEMLKPTIVTAPHFTMPQRDFTKTMFYAAQLMGYTRDEIDDCDALSSIASSWSLSDNVEASHALVAPNIRQQHVKRWRGVPKNMHPTKLQLNVPHHPWLDLWVWPSVRDRILALLEADVIEEDELCADILVCGHYDGCDTAFSVWGDDPLDPQAWEVGEEFARKWHFVLTEDIIKRSNWWRRQRGLKDMVIPGMTSQA